MSERLVLALEASFGPVAATLATIEGRMLAHEDADNPQGQQAEVLPPLVARLFAAAGGDPGQIERIAVTVGPGAFTGVRTGLAFAKGIGLATGAEVFGVTTLECLARQAAQILPGRCIAALIDAKRGEAFVAAYDSQLNMILPPQVMAIDGARDTFRSLAHSDWLITGSGQGFVVSEFRDAHFIDIRRIDTKLLARHCVDLDQRNYPASPVYLRAPDAKLPQ